MAFRPDKTGWVFILANYPWPGDRLHAMSLHFAQWHYWGGQVAVGVLALALASRNKGQG